MQEADLTELAYSLYDLCEGICARGSSDTWDTVRCSEGRKRPRWPLRTSPSVIWLAAFAYHLSLLRLCSEFILKHYKYSEDDRCEGSDIWICVEVNIHTQYP